jgi:hypothetical protein
MSDDALKLPIEFPEADRTQLQLQEVIKSLGAVERQILETGAASEANAKKILALTTSFTQGKVSAGELRAQLVALAGAVPKSADALRSEAAEAAKRYAAEAKKAADASAELAAKQDLIDRRARTLASSLEGPTSRMSRFAELGSNVGRGLVLAAGGAAALATGTLAVARAIAEANARADTHQRALRGVGEAYAGIERATLGTVTATEAYRMRMALLNAGIRVSDDALATIARHAREHGDVTKTTAERVEELTNALQGASADELQKYGIAVNSSASRTQIFRSALQQMTRAAGDSAPATRTAAEDLTRFSANADRGVQALGAFAEHTLGVRSAMNALGESIRSVANDMEELIERENQLPQNRAAARARTLATESYSQAQRGIGANLRGMGFSQAEIARLVPSTALGSLSPEQIQQRAAQLQRVQTLIGAQNMQRSQSDGLSLRPQGGPAATIFQGEGEAAPVMVARGGLSPMAGASQAEMRAALVGLRAARSGRGQDAARAEVRAALEGLAREMAGDATTNTAARTPRPPRGDNSAQSAPQDLTVWREAVWSPGMDAEFARIERTLGERRVPSFGRQRAAEMDAEASLREREITETPAALARLAQLRDREARDREARLEDLRETVQQAEQLVSLRRDEERLQRPLHVARQTALLNAQADVAHQQRMVSLAADLARASSDRGAENAVAETRLSGRAGRAQARNSRRAELADLRDPAFQQERLGDARQDRTVERERRALQDRIDAQTTFTEHMGDLHQRRVHFAREEAETVSMAFDSMGNAYAKHLVAVVQGREEMGAALQGMLADTLTSISEESAKKAGFNLAEGFANLARYDFGAAANNFTAFGIYTGLAVGSGLAGAAVTPSKPAAGGAAAAGAERDRGRALGTGRSGAANDNAKGTTIIEQHYYAPVIGGREATDGEVGRGMQRYQSAADRRRLGRTGTGP